MIRSPRIKKGICLRECGSCDEPNTVDMVQCDNCDVWYHFRCSNVDESISEKKWECRTCSDSKEDGAQSNMTTTFLQDDGDDSKTIVDGLQPGHKLQSQQSLGGIINDDEVNRLTCNPTKPVVATLRNNQHPSSICSNARRELNIKRELQRLEEEKQLEKLYLAKKYEILEQLADNENSDDEGSSVSHKRTQEWPFIKTQENRHNITKMAPSAAMILTNNQLSARHALFKELPSFSGRPEEWAVFISNFRNSTELCGFSDAENLVRLQHALKGNALEAVGCQLLFPSTVPEVISTLKMLYGRPELIIRTLIQKIRSDPPPKADRLESIVSFALSVRQLHSTMIAAELLDHLNNPMLVQELVDKLPATMKLTWALNSHETKRRTLTEFSNWMMKLADAASTVTSFPILDLKIEKRVGHLHMHTESGQQKQKSVHGSGICFVCKEDHRLVDCEKFKELPLQNKWDIVKEYSICSSCLRHYKQYRCRETGTCGIRGCTRRHHPLLHKYETETPRNLIQICNTHQNQQTNDVLFRVVPVTLYGNGKSLDTFAFLDSGSSLTLLNQNLANNLGLKGVDKPLCLKWTSEVVRMEEESQVVPLEISSRDKNSKRYKMTDVRTVEKFSLPIQSFDAEGAQKKYDHLKGLPLPSYNFARPGLLIGLKNENLGVALKVCEGKWDDPIAVKTRLGWLVCGGTGTGLVQQNEHVLHHYEACECDRLLHEDVNRFFTLENPVSEKTFIETSEEKRAIQILATTTKRLEGRYESGLLWKHDNVTMPDSYPMALMRLKCLERKVTKEPELLLNLDSQICNLVSKGYARKLNQKDLQQKHANTWYLPTFIVKNPNKPNKIRLVWDAAARAHGESLNTMLLKGPDQLAALPSVLYAFRTRRVAICGDIQEMFHQVHVREDDQHAQRFLWRKGDVGKTPDIYEMKVLTFGASCSPSIAQYIKNTNAKGFAQKYPRAVISIMENHYVDDLLDSVDSVDEAIQLAKDVKFIHSNAGFHIRNWLSNSTAVVKALGEECETEKEIQTDSPTSKVLGLWWKTECDMFTFSLRFTKIHDEILTGARMPTKRELLRILMSIFDPLGFLAYYLVALKILLQEVWKSGTDWDELIPSHLQTKWKSWLLLLPLVEDVRIPRCYSSMTAEENISIQLHVFVDASENAMAAVGYFRISNGSSVECALIGAKTKVSPKHPMSIPRMELQAAVIGTRLADAITKGHKIPIMKRVFWSDSRTVLYWLRSDAKKYKQFVMYRISEVLENSKLSEWKWIPTKQNVADEATKWAKTPAFDQNSRWFSAPLFLYEDESLWPVEPLPTDAKHEEEMRPRFLLLHTMTDEPFIKLQRFSSWQRLLRTTAWMVRFVNNLIKTKGCETLSRGMLKSEELQRAQTVLIKMSQYDTFSDEIAVLLKGGSLAKSSELAKCSPYIDEDGVLRMKGRIDNANCVPLHTKRPILMSKKHRTTLLILDYYHRFYHHRCHETVINEIRQRFWISSLRAQLKAVRKQCLKCRLDDAKPKNPEMAPLPPARLAAYTRPFTYVGVDYFGPILVTSGRRSEKRWCALFTCLTIRAVHLEMAYNLSTDSCIMCIRNFIGRRGMPKEFYSDNGTNFKGAERELREALQSIDNTTIEETFNSTETKWVFNPPAAPHMGGSWERLIGSVKSVLKVVTHNQRLQDESLQSFLIEVEAIINSRPLTHVPLEPDDQEALTPNHFILGTSNGCKLPGKFDEKDLLLQKSWKKCQRLSDMFWKRWVREYLPTLTRRAKWFGQAKPVEVGDIVIVVDDELPRNSWPKGVVLSTIKAKDGQVRRVTVKTSTGTYIRPTVKLAVLDIARTE